MNSRYDGFTIIELLVGMIISSLILTLVWNVFFFAREYKDLIETKAEKLVRYKKIEMLLKTDMNTAQSYELSENRLTIEKDTSTVIYDFQYNQLVRSQLAVVDTFKLVSEISEISQSLKICLGDKTLEANCFSVSLPYSSWVKISGDQ